MATAGSTPLGAFTLLLFLCAASGEKLGNVGTPLPDRTLFYCNFDEDNCKGLLFNADTDDDNYDWRRQQGGTQTWDTGPSGDHTSGKGFYVYAEANGGVEGDRDVISLDTLVARSDTTCVAFYYHMHGSETGSLKMFLDSQQEWALSGDQGDKWIRATKEFSTQPNSNFNIFFEATRGAGNKGDIALDDVHIIDGPCSLFGSSNVLFSCNFEAACDRLTPQDDGDQYDWQRRQSRTDTANTGPEGDHTFGDSTGHFIYTEATGADRQSGDVARIVTEPAFRHDYSSACLVFWYHMFGEDIGELSVTVVQDGTSDSRVWEELSPQRNVWQEAVVTINTARNTNFRIQFSARHTGGDKGDIALDDITLTSGPCSTGGPGWSDWSEWSACSVTCGDGRRQRERQCPQDAPDCPGASTEYENCFAGPCTSGERDVQWGDWQDWGPCSASCGVGHETRNRTCVNGDCLANGPALEKRECNLKPCDQGFLQDSVWEEWGDWSPCSASCGGGFTVRNRTCIQGNCLGNGPSQETRACNGEACAEYAEWADWGPCSVSCGAIGMRERSRGCKQGDCAALGPNSQREDCSAPACPVWALYLATNGDDGEEVWGPWSDWTDCSASCGPGLSVRTRSCLDGGCQGTDREERDCNITACPVDEEVWGPWSDWTACSASCGPGLSERTRTCLNASCQGADREEQDCNVTACPVVRQEEEVWGPWSNWTACSVSCGPGLSERTRTCLDGACQGTDREERDCNVTACPVGRQAAQVKWGPWSNWTACSASCGPGLMERSRSCLSGACQGASKEELGCNIAPCPVGRQGPVWGDWEEWGDCSFTCGGGVRKRNRRCVQGTCQGSFEDEEPCNRNPCVGVEPPVWENWEEWGDCSRSCGGGIRRRKRQCKSGGCLARGEEDGTELCNPQACLECSGAKADITFVIDSSGSIRALNVGQTDNWMLLLGFMETLVSNLPIGEDDIHVAAVSFSNDARIDFHLDSYYDKDQLVKAILNIEYMDNFTNTADGLRVMKEEVFDPAGTGRRGDRPNVTNIAVVITDGESNVNQAQTIPTADEAKRQGITVLAVGITDRVNLRELAGISSSGREGDTYWRSPDFNVANNIIQGVLKQTCRIAVPAVANFTSWETWGPCSVTCGEGTRQRIRKCTATNGNCIGDTVETDKCGITACAEIKCKNRTADIVFVLDSSGSIRATNRGGVDNWELLLRFAENIVSRLTVGPDDMHFGAVTYSNNAIVNFRLDEFYDRDALIEQIRNIPYMDNLTNTAAGLSVMRTQVFDPSKSGRDGDRIDVPNICILLTDGASNVNPQRTIPTAIEAKRDNIYIFVVGITDQVNVPELKGMSSTGVEGETYWRSPDFRVADEIVDSILTETCQIAQDGVWFPWEQWEKCTAECGGGTQKRTRKCPQDVKCLGSGTSTRRCNEFQCLGTWDPWGDWETCSRRCGGGTQRRFRRCQTNNCRGRSYEQQECNRHECRQIWGQWGSWESCSRSCGGGEQRRLRRCEEGSCQGDTVERRQCGTQECREIWGFWGSWESCSRTCGRGEQRRFRRCEEGSCLGDTVERRLCNTQECREIWGVWGSWETCSRSCGGGDQRRYRRCQEGNCQGDTAERRSCNTHECRGRWEIWDSWGPCSETCGGGTQRRFRRCFGGPCGTGPDVDTRSCNTNQCIGNWQPWQRWEPCSATCGGGNRRRFRVCDSQTCLGNTVDRETCNTQLCIGRWNPWNNWDQCTRTCGGGTQRRFRTCGTSNCQGSRSDERACNSQQCIGDWDNWGFWTSCSRTCGGGSRQRTRNCLGGNCRGDSTQSEACSTQRCRGDWNPWENWQLCSTTCGGGTRQRYRSCRTTNCRGRDNDIGVCNTQPCIGTYGPWEYWESCSASCGGGVRIRRRRCDGFNCQGSDTDRSSCNTEPCIGDWNPWDNWLPCSAQCDGGTRTRSRTCTTDTCQGANLDRASCNTQPCDGRWDDWGYWEECSRSCGGGTRRRFRRCRTGFCRGPDFEAESCSKDACVGQWTDWGNWGDCSRTCDGGTKRRYRQCLNGICRGDNVDTETCNKEGCVGQWSVWGSWSTCSRTCGQGIQQRTRTCRLGNCPGLSVADRQCDEQPCFGEWTRWGLWGECSHECDGGTRHRYRQCISGNCDGVGLETDICNNQPCPGDWSLWEDWLACTRTCGRGIRTRIRRCNSGSCTGDSFETAACNTDACHGHWDRWGPWTECSRDCGGGTRTRDRDCIGGNCIGASLERQRCNSQVCLGELRSWGPWEPCSRTCGGGLQRRMRTCTNDNCNAPLEESRTCGRVQCRGTLSSWTQWTACSVSCGGGTRTRVRTCSNNNCDNEPLEEREICDTGTCMGTWSYWQTWEQCSQTCGGGRQHRVRTCSNNNCVGTREQVRTCRTEFCPGTWSEWSDWSRCSRECGTGTRVSTRLCSNTNCQGSSHREEFCNIHRCPGQWFNWGDWEHCTRSCGGGSRRRFRRCNNNNCQGNNYEEENCNNDACYGEWLQWSRFEPCSKTCGGGSQRRTRSCSIALCKGVSYEDIRCNTHPCAGEWYGWGNWETCSKSCGGGVQRRYRTCSTNHCRGDNSQQQYCNRHRCLSTYERGWTSGKK